MGAVEHMGMYSSRLVMITGISKNVMLVNDLVNCLPNECFNSELSNPKSNTIARFKMLFITFTVNNINI